MATISRYSKLDKEEVAHWTRVIELGAEVGLREAGFPESDIGKTLLIIAGASLQPPRRYLRVHFRSNFTPFSTDFNKLSLQRLVSTNNDALAVLLATVGRAFSSNISDVKFAVNGPRLPRHKSEAIALSVNLRSNRNITNLVLDENWAVGTLHGCAHLAIALRANSAVKYLSMANCDIDKKAVACLLDGLKENKTLVSLNLSHNPLLDSGMDSVAGFLTTNPRLKRLYLFQTHCGFQGADHMAFALESNNTLEELDFGGNDKIGRDGIKRLLEPLSQNVRNVDAADSSDNRKNTTLKTLRIRFSKIKDFPAESVARMIATNKNISNLDMGLVSMSPEEWSGHIFASLKENSTLEQLDLSRCEGLIGDLEGKLMDFLRWSATGLRTIYLTGTDLSYTQGRVDEELRINARYGVQLRGQSRSPTTSGRLVLCGFEFAGKTAIRKTMERIDRGSTRIGEELSMGWKKTIKKAPRLRKFLYGKEAHRELTTRTRGFDILVLQKPGFLASVWDFAGQIEYYALHDYLFPSTVNSCFLYVCSSRCPPDLRDPRGKVKDERTMREEFLYWMRFIASNSRPQQGGESHTQRLPQVIFVLTKRDTLDPATLNTSTQYAEGVVREVKDKFKAVIDLSGTVVVVNANSSEDVKQLTSLENSTLKVALEHETEYEVCKAVRSCLENWSAKNPSQPLLSLAKVKSILDDQVKTSAPVPYRKAKLYENNIKEVVLAYLNDTGDLIFPKALDFIVVNPRWFGVGIFGSLTDALGGVEDYNQPTFMCTCVSGRPASIWKLHHKDGFAARADIEKLLKRSLQITNLPQTDFLDELEKLMIHLELCFEKEPGKADSPLFIPALFDNEMEAARGLRQLQWKLERDESSIDESLIYLGRRLECEDKYLTFLTPGFFPRLQVHLRNYIHDQNWTGNRGFEVGSNLICFAENGVEVIVEYSGSIDYFVDILVRSSKPHGVALEFVQQHVVKTIVQFCASPQGCQGVLLVEAVIRPVCVKDLHLCMNRKVHSVLVKNLRADLAKDNVYEHTWSHNIQGVKDIEFARDLLEGEGSHTRFLRSRQQGLVPECASRYSEGQKYTDWQHDGSRTELETFVLQEESQGFRGIKQPELYEFKQDAITYQSSQALDWSSEIKGNTRQVNESLFELYTPDVTPKIQIVLFHGLQMGNYLDAHFTTWQSGDGSILWPQAWLVEDIPGAQVLSVSYPGGLSHRSGGVVDMYIITENLLSDLLQGKVGQVPHCPVVLVGHSVGGLVIKQLCQRADTYLNYSEGSDKAKLEMFLKSIRGIFYYATPHHGSKVSKILAEKISSPLLTYFEPLSKDPARLNSEFEAMRKAHYKHWQVASLGESLPTNLGPFEAGVASMKDFVAPEASARTENFNLVEEADHFSVCRPSSKRVRSFVKLRDFVSRIANESSDGDKI